MKLLTFLARRFAWSPHAPTIEATPPEPPLEAAPLGEEQPPAAAAADDARALAAGHPPPGAVDDCVVVFVHAEARDEDPVRRKTTLDQARKHVEWLARKKDARSVVLHSFAHLGGVSASPAFGREWMDELGAKLAARGYTVSTTPFGWTNAWELSVHGESVAKVWKDI